MLDASAASGTRALSPSVVDRVTYALSGVIRAGTGTAANIGRPAAGKTGTAESFKDAWFCGFVPQLATCVWVGYPQAEIPLGTIDGFGEVVGGSIPARIWHDFMSGALAGTPVKPLPAAPSGLLHARGVQPATGTAPFGSTTAVLPGPTATATPAPTTTAPPPVRHRSTRH
jgi:penicillin-binding protein 1A